MAKNQRKLQSELDKNLKAIDEVPLPQTYHAYVQGIQQLESLEAKLNNAPTQSMKEKYEIEMKKEIKKLQRVRDYFRGQMNNPDIKDKSKPQEARRRVEIEMERFRAHEKEFKKKQFSKKALQTAGHDKNNTGSDDSDLDSDYGDEDLDDDDDDDENNEDEMNEERVNQQKIKDKEYFLEVLEFLKAQASKLEIDLETLRNKKVKGPPKKQKEKQGQLNTKVVQAKRMKDKIEEITNSLEFIDILQIRNLKVLLGTYMLNTEDEGIKLPMETEIAKLMEIVENNKKIQQNNLQMLRDQQKALEIRQKVDLDKHPDVIKSYCRVEDTTIGSILDAQDYLGAWHLAIVIKEKIGQNQEREIHFLPYNNHKRDEVFKEEDQNKIAPAFTHTEIPAEPEKSFTVLRDYLASYMQKQQQFSQQPIEERKQPAAKIAPIQSQIQQQQPSSNQVRVNSQTNSQQNQASKSSTQSVNITKQGKQSISEEEEKVPPLGIQPLGGNLFPGPNPFSQLIQQQTLQHQLVDISTPTSILQPTQQDLGGSILSGLQQTANPHLDKTLQVLELLEASFRNIPQPQDQEVQEAKHPVPLKEDNMFPTVPLFNRKENFSRFDLDTLFFAFYYQQGTYQQYLAAIELKKKNWMFHKKYHTWFRKIEPGEQLPKGTQGGKYVYFEYESSWSQKVSTNTDFDDSQFENELQIDDRINSLMMTNSILQQHNLQSSL